MQHKIKIRGRVVDDQTRCAHYDSLLDVIAIKFKCCDVYYPCYRCHLEFADHEPIKWPESEWEQKAILCGVCKHELTIAKYFASENKCPECSAEFNPNCKVHYHLYFD